jgi:hypothetical protein
MQDITRHLRKKLAPLVMQENTHQLVPRHVQRAQQAM